MRIHDYFCDQCGQRFNDFSGENPTCCNHILEPYYGNWDEMKVADSGNNIGEDRYSDGRIRNFKALDDPLTKAELGGKIGDSGVTRLTKEARQEFRERLAKDGDSVGLRQAILDARKKK